MPTSGTHFLPPSSATSAMTRSGSRAKMTWSTLTFGKSAESWRSSARPARIFWVIVRGGSPARARIGDSATFSLAWNHNYGPEYLAERTGKVAARYRQGQGRSYRPPPFRHSLSHELAASVASELFYTPVGRHFRPTGRLNAPSRRKFTQIGKTR